MYAEFYRGSALVVLPIIALVIFMAVFASVVIRIYFKKSGDTRYRDLAALPLRDDTHAVSPGESNV